MDGKWLFSSLPAFLPPPIFSAYSQSAFPLFSHSITPATFVTIYLELSSMHTNAPLLPKQGLKKSKLHFIFYLLFFGHVYSRQKFWDQGIKPEPPGLIPNPLCHQGTPNKSHCKREKMKAQYTKQVDNITWQGGGINRNRKRILLASIRLK